MSRAGWHITVLSKPGGSSSTIYLTAIHYSARHERLLITWTLGTLTIAGPKVPISTRIFAMIGQRHLDPMGKISSRSRWRKCGLAVQHGHCRELGASGMVIGGLWDPGRAVIAALRVLREKPLTRQSALAGFLAGTLLFVLLGLEPHSDIYATVGGFFSDIIFGVTLNNLPRRSIANPRVDLLAGIRMATMMILTWWLAMRRTRNKTVRTIQRGAKLISPSHVGLDFPMEGLSL